MAGSVQGVGHRSGAASALRRSARRLPGHGALGAPGTSAEHAALSPCVGSGGK